MPMTDKQTNATLTYNSYEDFKTIALTVATIRRNSCTSNNTSNLVSLFSTYIHRRPNYVVYHTFRVQSKGSTNESCNIDIDQSTTRGLWSVTN